MPQNLPFILLADDNPDDQSFIRDAFSYTNANVQLRILDSGNEVVHYLKTQPQDNLPSLIVLDYNMPELNGAEVLALLAKEERYQRIPKLILSTSVFKQHVDKCISLGATGYLMKPDNFFDWKKLAHQILNYIQPAK